VGQLADHEQHAVRTADADQVADLQALEAVAAGGPDVEVVVAGGEGGYTTSPLPSSGPMVIRAGAISSLSGTSITVEDLTCGIATAPSNLGEFKVGDTYGLSTEQWPALALRRRAACCQARRRVIDGVSNAPIRERPGKVRLGSRKNRRFSGLRPRRPG
jgi:hypothetical protein